MSCGCGKQRTRNVEVLWATIADLERQLAEARDKLKNCGQENCMGYKLDTAANWVREERLTEVREAGRTAQDNWEGWIKSELEGTSLFKSAMEETKKTRAILGEKGA